MNDQNIDPELIAQILDNGPDVPEGEPVLLNVSALPKKQQRRLHAAMLKVRRLAGELLS